MVTSLLAFLSLPLLLILAEYTFVQRIFGASSSTEIPRTCSTPTRLNHEQPFPNESHSH
ncbi:MAG: hypothetical protein WCD18_09715 [Thermosynechococcaceae cyanobacterium]